MSHGFPSFSSWEVINLTSALVLVSFTVTLHHSTLHKVLEENEVLWSIFFPINLDRGTRLNYCNHRIQNLTCMLIKVGRFFFCSMQNIAFSLSLTFLVLVLGSFDHDGIHGPRLVLSAVYQGVVQGCLPSSDLCKNSLTLLWRVFINSMP